MPPLKALGTARPCPARCVPGQPTWSPACQGFERKLTLVGVGYRAQAQGDKLNLTLGFPILLSPDACWHQGGDPTQTEILIKSVDKQAVGKVAAEVRAYRAPEPYIGQGRPLCSDEVVTLKETKKK